MAIQVLVVVRNERPAVFYSTLVTLRFDPFMHVLFSQCGTNLLAIWCRGYTLNPSRGEPVLLNNNNISK